MVDDNLYGADLFGNPIERPSHGKLTDTFIVPPFSVLDARQGYWQERKRAWLSLGIQSEIGRGECRPHGKDERPVGEDGRGKYGGGIAGGRELDNG